MSYDVEQQDSASWIDRVELAIALALQIGIFVVTVSALFEQQWLGAFTGFVVLFLTFAPAMIERRLRLALPVEFTLITCVFLYASFALGEAGDYYEKVWWWDLALHGLSALTIGIIGFLIIDVFQRVSIRKPDISAPGPLRVSRQAPVNFVASKIFCCLALRQ